MPQDFQHHISVNSLVFFFFYLNKNKYIVSAKVNCLFTFLDKFSMPYSSKSIIPGFYFSTLRIDNSIWSRVTC